MPTLDENLITAAEEGDNEKVIKLLKSGADPKASNQYGNTALHRAARKGHLEIVTALLEKGADPKAKDLSGRTPLHRAAYFAPAAVVTALLEKGADPDAKDNGGNTALHYVALQGDAAVVELLLAGGAAVDKADQNCQTALDWAAKRDHAGIKVKIEKYIKSGDYKWRQHLPRLRQAAWNYYNSDKPVGIANKVIPYFLHSISLPQKRLAFAKLLNKRLSETSPGKGLSDDILGIIGLMLAAQPKIINVKITEIFAKEMADGKIMPAVDALQKYKGSRPDVAREIIYNIIKLTELGKIFSPEGDFVGIDDIIKTLSVGNYAKVFKTTWFDKSLTTLQEVISDVSKKLGGESYSDPTSFVELKKELDPQREEVVKRRREIEIKMRKKTDHPSIQFGLTCSLFDNPDDNKIYNLDGEAAEPEPEFQAAAGGRR